MSYITRSDIEVYLNITLNTNGQATVDSLIPAVEAFAESHCNRKWNVSGAQTEVFDGDTAIFFPANPVQSVTSITIDGTAIQATDIYNYGSYIKLGYPAGAGNRNVTIVYTPTTVTIPADLKQALIQWTAEMFKSSEDAGKTAKRVTFGSVTQEFLVQDGIPKYVEMVLNRYRLSPV